VVIALRVVLGDDFDYAVRTLQRDPRLVNPHTIEMTMRLKDWNQSVYVFGETATHVDLAFHSDDICEGVEMVGAAKLVAISENQCRAVWWLLDRVSPEDHEKFREAVGAMETPFQRVEFSL
jgi:hypothetical protein